jgi:hypothetical protein
MLLLLLLLLLLGHVLRYCNDTNALHHLVLCAHGDRCR